MALGLTQPLTEVSTRCISWGKGGRCVRLTIIPPSCAVVMKSGNLIFLEPSGPLKARNGTALPFLYYFDNYLNNAVCDLWNPSNSMKKYEYFKFVPLHAVKTYAYISPFVLNLGTRLRCFQFQARVLYSEKRTPSYQLNSRLCEPQGRSGHIEDNVLLLPGRPVTAQNALRRLPD